jgi:hypothetical protein
MFSRRSQETQLYRVITKIVESDANLARSNELLRRQYAKAFSFYMLCPVE